MHTPIFSGNSMALISDGDSETGARASAHSQCNRQFDLFVSTAGLKSFLNTCFVLYTCSELPSNVSNMLNSAIYRNLTESPGILN